MSSMRRASTTARRRATEQDRSIACRDPTVARRRRQCALTATVRISGWRRKLILDNRSWRFARSTPPVRVRRRAGSRSEERVPGAGRGLEPPRATVACRPPTLCTIPGPGRCRADLLWWKNGSSILSRIASGDAGPGVADRDLDLVAVVPGAHADPALGSRLGDHVRIAWAALIIEFKHRLVVSPPLQRTRGSSPARSSLGDVLALVGRDHQRALDRAVEIDRGLLVAIGWAKSFIERTIVLTRPRPSSRGRARRCVGQCVVGRRCRRRASRGGGRRAASSPWPSMRPRARGSGRSWRSCWAARRDERQ